MNRLLIALLMAAAFVTVVVVGASPSWAWEHHDIRPPVACADRPGPC